MSHKNTILVVEDDLVTQQIISQALQRAGFATLATTTGTEALQILRSDVAVDWLLTDINLADSTNGWAVGSAFHAAHPHRKVVYTSAGGMPPVAANAICLSKPYQPASVVELFQRFAREEGITPDAGEPTPLQERRVHARQRSMLRGQIIFNNRFSTVDCIVRDLTPDGARLRFAFEASLPAAFELSLPLRGRRYEARIVWRSDEECGVQFLG